MEGGVFRPPEVDRWHLFESARRRELAGLEAVQVQIHNLQRKAFPFCYYLSCAGYLVEVRIPFIFSVSASASNSMFSSVVCIHLLCVFVCSPICALIASTSYGGMTLHVPAAKKERKAHISMAFLVMLWSPAVLPHSFLRLLSNKKIGVNKVHTY